MRPDPPVLHLVQDVEDLERAVATLPEGSSRTLGDPFAEKPKPVWLYVTLGVVALLLVLWIGGTVNEYIPLRWQFKHLVG